MGSNCTKKTLKVDFCILKRLLDKFKPKIGLKPVKIYFNWIENLYMSCQRDSKHAGNFKMGHYEGCQGIAIPWHSTQWYIFMYQMSSLGYIEQL